MKKVKPGDRVWVRRPHTLVERKIGTIVAAKKTNGTVRYLVEWETDLTDQPNGHHPGYRASEIVPTRHKSN